MSPTVQATAEMALKLDPADAYTHYALAKVLFYARKLDRFAQEVQKTVALNPSFADAKADFAIRFVNMGRLDEGTALAREAMRLNPLYPGWYHFAFANEAYHRHDYKRVIAETEKINWPNSYWTYFHYAAAYAQLGRKDEANTAAKELLRLRPDFLSPDLVRQVLEDQSPPPHFVEHWLGGLRKAGVFDEANVK